jgi:NADH-quinone oxidoreductase subunit L
MTISTALYTSILAPLIGATLAGVFGYRIGNRASHCVTIFGVGIAFLCAIYMAVQIITHNLPAYHEVIYAWGISEGFQFNIGFLVDRLTVVMMLTVTFVALLVHIYSIGYMKGDAGYKRFFSYMSLFTFFMLVLVSADNFLLLFFGWEGVGLVSYLLIGFWFQRESAAQGSLKAFVVNRVGDMGFILGIAAIFAYFGALDYATVFAKAPSLAHQTLNIFAHHSVSLPTLICLLLFIGAMGKSAQVPLHVWLPESMEGPTPISALIHAATMVTAGVYMVARLSPLFELSQLALSVVLVLGATGALFLGMVAVVQNDIKRVIAYSTLSQLGYMMAANGVSAFSAAVFHLVTHASFKALLFLAAGSVIIAMHHEQDMQKMGGLAKKMPVTYVTFLIGALALAAIPPFAGFYSKDAIIEVVQLATTPGASYAYVCLLLGAFVTALYIFRAFFLTFHAKPRFDQQQAQHIHESPATVTIPLVLLAIPAVLLGVMLAYPMLYDANTPLLADTIFVAPSQRFVTEIAVHYHSTLALIAEAFKHLPLWFSLAGIGIAWLCYIKLPQLPSWFAARFAWVYSGLIHKYGFDAFNDRVFVRGSRLMSQFFFNVADVKILDDLLINGSGRTISRLSALARRLQSGYIYHYALAMMVGLFGFLVWLLVF